MVKSLDAYAAAASEIVASDIKEKDTIVIK
jgi:hypothetical protein